MQNIDIEQIVNDRSMMLMMKKKILLSALPLTLLFVHLFTEIRRGIKRVRSLGPS